MEIKTFKLGDYVTCKKWNGQTIYGIYAYQGNDNSHFIVSKNKTRWNIKPNDIRLATKAEIQFIKDTIEITLNNTKQELQAINNMRTKLGLNTTTTTTPYKHTLHDSNNITELEKIMTMPIEEL